MSARSLQLSLSVKPATPVAISAMQPGLLAPCSSSSSFSAASLTSATGQGESGGRHPIPWRWSLEPPVTDADSCAYRRPPHTCPCLPKQPAQTSRLPLPLALDSNARRRANVGVRFLKCLTLEAHMSHLCISPTKDIAPRARYLCWGRCIYTPTLMTKFE